MNTSSILGLELLSVLVDVSVKLRLGESVWVRVVGWRTTGDLCIRVSRHLRIYFYVLTMIPNPTKQYIVITSLLIDYVNKKSSNGVI